MQRWSKYLFKDKIHISWVITAICLGFLIGVGLEYYPIIISQSTTNFLLLIAFILIVFVFVSRLRVMVLIALIAGILIGIYRGTEVQFGLADYEKWLGKEVILRGKIESDPDFVNSNQIRLRLVNAEIIDSKELNEFSLDKTDHDLDNGFTPLPGKIWVSVLSAKTNISRSDIVLVGGKLKNGFGTFAGSISHGSLEEVSHSSDADLMRDLRDGFGDKLRTVIGSPESDLGMGILAGQKTALPSELTAAFMAAGLMHIVVASGYNLTILIRFARRLFSRISRFAALMFSGGLVFCFASITGFSPSMTRASAVAMLSLIAWYYGRKFHPVTLLSVVAAITVAIDPSQLWGDAGWWMSFTSFVGVIILAPLIKAYFWGDDEIANGGLISRIKSRFKRRSLENEKTNSQPFSIRQIFIETISAQIMAAPVIALMMGQFSPYGLLANLLILPILPLTMLLTFIAGISAVILPGGLAVFVAIPADWALKYIINIADWIYGLPGAVQVIEVSPLVCVGIFLFLLCVIFCLKCKTQHNFRSDNVIE